WRGHVTPLDDRLSIYLAIVRRPGGGPEDVTAFIRDPERNSGLWLGLEEVRLQGDQLRISGRRGEIAATYDRANGTLTLRPAGYANDEPRKRRVTVEHLLTMTSGLECDDNDDESAGNEDNMQSQEGQPDWYKYALDLPMVREPGEAGVYCSAGINLLGGAVSN